MIDVLTPREWEIAKFVSLGFNNKSIAILVGTQHRTIERHVQNITVKLGLTNTERYDRRVMIARYFLFGDEPRDYSKRYPSK